MYSRTFVFLSTIMSFTGLSSVAIASPHTSNIDTLDHYIPGPVSSVVQSLDLDPNGVISVDDDGVMRSFSANGTVIDYHQLDPEQLESFAKSQLAAWENIDMDVPESVKALAEGDFADGRELLDHDLLHHPAHGPNLAGRSKYIKEREVLDELNNFQKRCVGTGCGSLADCLARGCAACFFPAGPPVGVCFLT
ncbi:Lactobacillus up-regulated protein [Paramyrothecium foliicola]|nr:Lactobacillus up-regulated protein [Paramyrothecium foliicola]